MHKIPLFKRKNRFLTLFLGLRYIVLYIFFIMLIHPHHCTSDNKNNIYLKKKYLLNVILVKLGRVHHGKSAVLSNI